MTAATSRLRRRGIGAGVAALVGLTTVGFSATSASAAPNFEITRPAQVADRFETAASVALAAFPNGAENVIIANGDNAVDALAASVLAGTDIPILYVTSNEIPAPTLNALEQLDPSASWIVGGAAAVSAAVEGELPGAIERIDGPTRYETAAALAQAVVDNAETAPTSAFIARGDDFADALAIAPYAAKSGIPVLLTETGTLSAAAVTFLANNDITDVTVLGGTAAVSDAVVEELEANDVTVDRIRGTNRQATAVDIANTEAFGFSNTGVALVNGWRPVDALPASVWAAQQNFPIILTAGAELGAEAQGYLTANQETLATGLAIGGTGAIPASVVEAAEVAAGAEEEPEAPATNQTFTVTPADASTLTVANEGGTTPASDDRQYSVASTSTTSLRIALFDADGVTNTNGAVSFEGTTTATTGTPAAEISVVNGTAIADGSTSAEAAPSAGALNFTIDGTSFGSVVPVIYNDADGDNQLDINTDGVPTESFGIGGVTSYLPAASGNVTFSDDDTATLNAVNKDNNTIVATTPAVEDDADTVDVDESVAAVSSTFTYDSNDTFYVAAPGEETPVSADNQVTAEGFAAVLTAGDVLVAGTDYRSTPSFQSTFVLVNQEPRPLTVQDVVEADTTATVTVSDPLDDATVNLYVAEGLDGTFEDAVAAGSATADADDDTDAFDVNLTGLTAGAGYTVFATQTVSGEESAESVGVPFTTLPEASDVTLTSATPGDINNGVGSASTIILTFSDDVTLVDVEDDADTADVVESNADLFSVSPTNQSGIVIPALSVAAGANANQVVVTIATPATDGGDPAAGQPLDDATTDISYTVTVDPNAVTDEDGGPNVERTATFNY
ncbi:cell wall-binding repeat-containing protein [Kineococcus arenarius]|uniref:cell wall-binding repeat-containing protein n=1 Tax=Kineococcus sp. SYSU DK007 TaxID=3383128 RepID=UPI003D7E4085